MKWCLVLAFAIAGCGGPHAGSADDSLGARGSGRALFVAKCNQCHDYPDPAKYSAAQWSRILTEMGRRAGLMPAERDQVLQYVLEAPERKERSR
jgi:hypothetical protein